MIANAIRTSIFATSTRFQNCKSLEIIIINPPPASPNAEQQQSQPPLQQIQQQLQQQPMAYAPIAKIKKFTGEENDAQLAFLQYFSNNNSINQLANTFTTIKQGENETVTTYLRCFYRNLCQIQAIQTDYFTVPQILNQFIRGLHSSILQCIHPIHPADLQAAITNTQDFEVAELETSHAQAINLVINGSSELDFKLKQFSDSINQKLERYLADNHTIYQPPQQHNNSENLNHFQNQSHPLSSNQLWQQETPISTNLPANDATANISTTHISTFSLSTATTNNISITTATNNLSDTHTIRIITVEFRNQNYLSLLVTTENALPNIWEPKQKQLLTNILPATVIEDESLAVIFPFKIEKLTETSLFSGATLEEKPIMAMYTDAKVDSHSIKLILDIDHAANTRIITANGATKTPISKIDDFPIEVNGITISIKVLVMEAT
ncbi:hypothetical protein G9A89_007122 [Geosiphon pyriformis]|nr:hypothetical protein G9A89_007122 [Geosiphon pyriformis]